LNASAWAHPGVEGEGKRVAATVPGPARGAGRRALRSAVDHALVALLLVLETDLEGIGEAYAAMDERRAIKSLIRVGTL
jgi:hypothetical protein